MWSGIFCQGRAAAMPSWPWSIFASPLRVPGSELCHVIRILHLFYWPNIFQRQPLQIMLRYCGPACGWTVCEIHESVVFHKCINLFLGRATSRPSKSKDGSRDTPRLQKDSHKNRLNTHSWATHPTHQSSKQEPRTQTTISPDRCGHLFICHLFGV